MAILKRLLTDNIISNTTNNILSFLTATQKKKGVNVILLLLLSAFLDVLGLTSIIPIVYIAQDMSVIEGNYYLNTLYQFVGIQDKLSFLLFLSFLLVVIFLLKNTISLYIQYFQSKYAFDIALSISQRQYQYYYNQGYLFSKEIDTGTIIYTICSAPIQFANLYIMPLLFFFIEVVVVLMILIGLFIYSPSLVFFLGLVLIPSFLIIYMWTRNKVKRLGDEKDKILPKSLGSAIEGVKGLVDIKLFNKEQDFLDKYSRYQKRINDIEVLNTNVYGKIYQKMNEVILAMGIFALFLFAVIFREYQSDLLLMLSIMATAAIRVMPSVNRIVNALMVIKQFSFLNERLGHLKLTKVSSFEKIKKMTIKESIQGKDISYKYNEEGEWVLRNIYFHIKKGETIGFIGKSGSGKSTLLYIILRFLKEAAGGIYVDGKQLTKEANMAFQKNIGYVRQDVFIRDASLESNITMNIQGEQKEIERLNKVISQAALGDLDIALDHEIKENGANLSGGQKQRIGIARALYKNAEILIFDEPTSALDEKTEQRILDTIRKLKSLGKTIIIVTHKKSTLKYCDKVYQLSDGSIKEEPV